MKTQIEALFTGLISTYVNFAVYRDETVPGWPESYRKLVRHGACALIDLDRQAINPGEAVFVTEGDVSVREHSVSIAPYPHIVEMPQEALQ